MLKFFLPFILSGVSLAAEFTLPNLVKGLGSEDFTKRQAASQVIQKWAKTHREKALQEIPILIKSETDPETKSRLKKIVKEIFLNQKKAHFGFLFGMTTVNFENKVTTGLMVTRTIIGGPSDRGGMIRGDIVTSINQQFFPKDITMDELAEIFSRQPIGEKSKIRVKRKEAFVILNITPTMVTLTDEEISAREKLFEKWIRKQTH